MATTAKLSSKSQIVIPAEVRRVLGLRPGDSVRFAVDEDRVTLSKQLPPEDAVARLRSLGGGLWRELEQELERGRASWDERDADLERIWAECRSRDAV